MELKNIKMYAEMSVNEQMHWVTEFEQWMPDGRIVSDKAAAKWTNEDNEVTERGLRLLAAWPFAQDYCEKTAHFGDYSRRAYMFKSYIDMVVDALGEGMTVINEEGKTLVQITPSTPLRRRGRPTKEEQRAKALGETLVIQGGDNAEAKKRKAIARILGLDVIVQGEPPREKNNDELRAERREREEREKKMNPDMFEEKKEENVQEAGMEAMAVAQMGNISETMPNLRQIKWLLSEDAAQGVDRVAELRNLRAAESERAKTMADMGAKAEDIEPHAKAAIEATKSLKDIFHAIDVELAEVNYRLKFDKRYPEKLQSRFKTVDIELLTKITNPYLKKMCEESPTFMQTMQSKVDEEQPERIAEREKQEKDKKEVALLIRYITRRDKGPSDERCKTLEKRIKRLRELRGDEVADAYMPILEKTKEENEKMHAEKAAKKNANRKKK